MQRFILFTFLIHCLIQVGFCSTENVCIKITSKNQSVFLTDAQKEQIKGDLSKVSFDVQLDDSDLKTAAKSKTMTPAACEILHKEFMLTSEKGTIDSSFAPLFVPMIELWRDLRTHFEYRRDLRIDLSRFLQGKDLGDTAKTNIDIVNAHYTILSEFVEKTQEILNNRKLEKSNKKALTEIEKPLKDLTALTRGRLIRLLERL